MHIQRIRKQYDSRTVNNNETIKKIKQKAKNKSTVIVVTKLRIRRELSHNCAGIGKGFRLIAEAS
eukprot:753370-Hanusia_phi.AAC.12